MAEYFMTEDHLVDICGYHYISLACRILLREYTDAITQNMKNHSAGVAYSAREMLDYDWDEYP